LLWAALEAGTNSASSCTGEKANCRNARNVLQCFAVCVDGNWAGGTVFTVVWKMHAAQLLTALCSLNVQQSDCVLCGSGEQ